MREARIIDWSRLTYTTVVWTLGSVGLLIMVGPVVVGLLMSLTAGNTLIFPPEGLSLRWYGALFDPDDSGRIHRAALTSLVIAVGATVLTIAVAVPASLGLARSRHPAFAVTEAFLMLPLVLPTLVYGVAALMLSSALGIPTSRWLVVAGHTAIFLPLALRATLAVVTQLDPRLTESSRVLGARRGHTFRRITLPLILPGVLSGAFLVFMNSLDNVSVSLFLADARTSVLPVRLWRMIEESLDVRVAAISGVTIVMAIVLFIAGEWFKSLAVRVARRDR